MQLMPAKIYRFLKYSLTSALAVIGMSAATTSNAVEIDLLILYDNYSKDYFNNEVDTAMRNWVTQMNNAYVDSKVDLQIRLVGVVAHEQGGKDDSATLDNLSTDKSANELRNRYGADFVSHLHKNGDCGIGYFSVDADDAWNLVGPDCSALTMVHEMGHNMGLDHSRKQGDSGGKLYKYGLGYGVDSLFSTIMAYPSVFRTTRIARFSNPEINCKGVPCGVPVGDSQQAFAALALNNVKDRAAGYKPAATPTKSSAARSSVAAASSKPTTSKPTTSKPASAAASSRPSTAGCANTIDVAFDARSEVTLDNGSCIRFSKSLSGATVQFWDSDTGSVCDYRGTATSVTGGGSQVISRNYVSTTVLNGTTIKMTNAVGSTCKFLKVRAY